MVAALLTLWATMAPLAPPLPVATVTVHHDAYSAEISCRSRSPIWVRAVVCPWHLAGAGERHGAFRLDPEVPAACQAQLSDYVASGQDRGHVIASADRSGAAQARTYLLSNVMPQAPRVNRGVWRSIEGEMREQVRERGCQVITGGPAYLEGRRRWLGGRVEVPSHYWRVVRDPWGGGATAYLVPAGARRGRDAYRVEVGVLVERVGLQAVGSGPAGAPATSSEASAASP